MERTKTIPVIKRGKGSPAQVCIGRVSPCLVIAGMHCQHDLYTVYKNLASTVNSFMNRGNVNAAQHFMMSHLDNDNDTQAGNPLTDWSKWLININVFATTGCIVGLKTAGAAKEKTGFFFFVAIVAFCLSVICASGFILLVARERVKKGQMPKNLYWMPVMQWVLFVTGILFVLTWIAYLSGTI